MMKNIFWYGLFAALLAIAPQLNIRTQQTQDRFAMFDGMRVHYQSRGEGREVLIFVHGLTCDLSFWKGQIPAFEKKTRVLVIDLPGHGQSDRPRMAYTIDLFARAVDAVLRDAGVEKAVLVGHSMGTPVIRQFYRRFPDKTRALVIVDGPLIPFGDRAALEKFLEQFRGPNYQATWAQLVSSQVQPVKDPALREEIKAKMLGAPQHVAVSAMEGMLAPEIWQPDQIKVPVLAVLAKLPHWPADNEQSFRGIAPELDYQMWEGVSHFLMMDRPQDFNEALFAFLKKKGLIKR